MHKQLTYWRQASLGLILSVGALAGVAGDESAAGNRGDLGMHALHLPIRSR